MLADHLQRLIQGEEVQLPRYNFKTGLREDGELIRLKNGQPIILEGIHGMDPRLMPEGLSGEAFRIYVSALTQLNLDRHNRVSTTDTRLIRRIVRDARERGYTCRANDRSLGIGTTRREAAYLPVSGKCKCDVQLGAGL